MRHWKEGTNKSSPSGKRSLSATERGPTITT